jgi:hypothetical protein
VYVPYEAFESGNDYTIKVWIKMVNISATYPSVTFVIMGQEITATANGWSAHSITARPDPDEEMSQLYNLSVYRAGLDNAEENWSNLVDFRVPGSPPRPYIQGLCIWGV